MPFKCCVPNCSSNYNSQVVYVTVYRFPTSPELRAKWIQHIPRENLVINNNTRICIKHFEERFIRRKNEYISEDGEFHSETYKIPALTSDAYPTIFDVTSSHVGSNSQLWPQVASKRKQKKREQSKVKWSAKSKQYSHKSLTGETSQSRGSMEQTMEHGSSDVIVPRKIAQSNEQQITTTQPVIIHLLTEPKPQPVWTNLVVQQPRPAANISIQSSSLMTSYPCFPFTQPGSLTTRAADISPSIRRRHSGNGLRQFAEDVLRKVERKGITTYNEVADELVADMQRSAIINIQVCEEKNIRRRVYDALNVLLAMKIITKDRKLIRWYGMPASLVEQKARLERKKNELLKKVSDKKQELNELIVQQVAFVNLMKRNSKNEKEDESSAAVKLYLPFIVVNTRQLTGVDCWMSSNRDTYVFNFNDRFEMHDDIEVLKRSGLAFGLESGNCHGADLDNALKLVGVNLRPYIIEMAVKSHLSVLNEPKTTSDDTTTPKTAAAGDKSTADDSVVISQTLQVSESSAPSSTNVTDDCAADDDDVMFIGGSDIDDDDDEEDAISISSNAEESDVEH